MGNLSNEERTKRELAGEYIVEALLGEERAQTLIHKNVQAFLKLASVFSEQSGMTSETLFELLKSIRGIV